MGNRHGQVVALTERLEREGRAQRVQRGVVLALAPCAGGFVSAGADGLVQVLAPDGAPLARLRFRRGGFLWALAKLDDTGRAWLVGGEGGRVHRVVWDGERLVEVGRTPMPAPVRSLAAHPTWGAWVGLHDGRVVALHAPRGPRGRRDSLPSTIDAHRGPVTALALMRTGGLVSGGEDGRVQGGHRPSESGLVPNSSHDG